MSSGGGDWLLIQELFERSDPSFVDELREFDDADTLAAFAPRWFADKRPESRRLLLDYLARPLNAYRHEALVKRLFKLAEAAGDDEIMGRFLVAFDRCVRRVFRQRRQFKAEVLESETSAEELAQAWRAQGFESVQVYRTWQKKYQVSARWTEPVAVMPTGTTMPRGRPLTAIDPNSWDQKTRRYKTFSVPDWVFKLGLLPWQFRDATRVPDEHRKTLERWRLFSLRTRHYLRRRSWRYFRRLGRRHPDRYLPAVMSALLQYQDTDVADVAALLDNWGLNHVLFHFSPCLTYTDRAWSVAPGHSLAELEPAPIFARFWRASPRSLVELLIHANCRAVRGWAIRMARRDLATVAAVFPLEERLGLLTSDDSDVVNFVAELLRDDLSLKDIPVARWFNLAESANPVALEIFCELMERWITPDQITLAQAVRLAMQRPFPLARLGLGWLRSKAPADEDECRSLLALGEAESDAVRPELIRWAADVLSRSEAFRSEWVLEWLDSRHKDVRDAAMAWFRNEPRVRNDVAIWQRLMETPYDDIRLALVAELEEHTRGASASRLERGDLDPELLRLLWASVLLNVYRGNRAKLVVVRQLLRRIEQRPAELSRLLSLLAVALRSVRGPEWRAGLSAVVRLAERDASTVPLIYAAFPELQLA